MTTGPMPLVSVVMPSYNQAAYLEAAIRSVLDQDHPRVELIVVDGGSTDGSAAIIERYADRLAWWVSEPDNGQAAAINRGFTECRGDILCWLNSDDLLRPGALRRVAEQLDAGDVQWLIGASEAIDADGKMQGLVLPHAPSLVGFFDWGAHGFIQPSVFWNRAMWEQAGPLDEHLHFGMDLDLWLRMYWVTQPRVVDEVYSAHRLHDQAKCLARRAEMHAEYDAWLVDLLAGRMPRIPEAQVDEIRHAFVAYCGELKWRDASLRRIVGHPVLGTVIRLWRRWFNRDFPDPGALARRIELGRSGRRE